MPEYECYPLWIRNGDEPYKNVSVDYFPLKKSLKRQIIEWDLTYQNTIDKSCPLDSDFKNEEDKRNFEKEGLLIFDNMTTELKTVFNVTYYSVIEDKLYSRLIINYLS